MASVTDRVRFDADAAAGEGFGEGFPLSSGDGVGDGVVPFRRRSTRDAGRETRGSCMLNNEPLGSPFHFGSKYSSEPVSFFLLDPASDVRFRVSGW